MCQSLLVCLHVRKSKFREKTDKFLLNYNTLLWRVPFYPNTLRVQKFPDPAITRIRPGTRIRHPVKFPNRFTSSFYRASICEGGLGSRNSVRPSVCLSVCLSVTRVHCDKTKWRTADILIPHERAIILLLWHQQWLVGDAPFPLKSALRMTHPSKNPDFHRFPLITSQP